MEETGDAERRWQLILLLVPLGRSWLGFDLEQLDGIAEGAGTGTDGAIFSLSRLFGLEAASGRESRIVTVKGDELRRVPSYRLRIETPEDVQEVDWRAIRPLPPLLEPFTRRLGVWGLLPLADGRLVLLFDGQAVERHLLENLPCEERS